MTADARLVQKARNGDRRAYEELVRMHQDQVFRFAFYNLSSRQDAEDVAQETFVEAFKALGRFRGDASFLTWVLSIARMRIALVYRRRKPEVLFADCEGMDFIEPEKSAFEFFEVRAAVAQLPEAYREMIVLKYTNGLNLLEIAETTGVSPTAVGVRLFRARKMLRNILEDVVEKECKSSATTV